MTLKYTLNNAMADMAWLGIDFFFQNQYWTWCSMSLRPDFSISKENIQEEEIQVKRSAGLKLGAKFMSL